MELSSNRLTDPDWSRGYVTFSTLPFIPANERHRRNSHFSSAYFVLIVFSEGTTEDIPAPGVEIASVRPEEDSATREPNMANAWDPPSLLFAIALVPVSVKISKLPTD